MWLSALFQSVFFLFNQLLYNSYFFSISLAKLALCFINVAFKLSEEVLIFTEV